jgi:hypothetical protein
MITGQTVIIMVSRITFRKGSNRQTGLKGHNKLRGHNRLKDHNEWKGHNRWKGHNEWKGHSKWKGRKGNSLPQIKEMQSAGTIRIITDRARNDQIMAGEEEVNTM